jgi:pimeloyl-ACP methyl ester carboxylesterase
MRDKGKMYPVNGIHLHVVEKGEKGAPVIVFLHGFPEFWYGWRNQIDFFVDKGYRVIVPDQRGYNLSDKPGSIKDYQITELTKDIAHLIKAIGEKQVFLVGHDLGAAVCWSMAYLYPELIRKLVILNVPHPIVMQQTLRSDVRQLLKSWYIGFFQLPWLPELYSEITNYKLLSSVLLRSSLPDTFTKEDLQRYQQAWQQKNAYKSMVNWYRALARYRNPASGFVQKIKIPTLIIWGVKDKFLIKEMGEKSMAYCQNGKLEQIPDATHWVHHEKSHQVNQLIFNFIQEA